MLRISHQTLRWMTVIPGIIGQFMLDTSPQAGILLCGIALAASLLDGWWYPVPLGAAWWYPALWAVIGLSMWDQPRGWFFMGMAAIDIGTGLRARALWRAYAEAVAAERARVDNLRQMGFEPASDLIDALPDETPGATEPAAPPVPLPPVVWWRYVLAVLLGLMAAWLGAWCTRIAFHMTGWQLDILAYFVGYMVGKAVTAGAGNRSNRALRIVAAALGGGGVLYGRYLLVRFLVFEQSSQPYTAADVVGLAVKYPGQVLGVWLLLFVALGVWSGWRYAHVAEERQVQGRPGL